MSKGAKNKNKLIENYIPIKYSTILFCTGMVALWGECVHADTLSEPSSPVKQSRSVGVLEEVVVTARRKDELLQDVPITVQAISGDTLKELNLFSFEELSKVMAGVSLSSENGGLTTIRGVSFNPTAQTNPTTAFYINESPVQPALAFQSVFDIEQFEVLRGPQGTGRGQSAPTGAITVNTRQANLSEFGGSFMASITDADGQTIQGAVNLPIIEDVLGVRIAGITDHNDGDGTSSVHSSADSYSETDAARVSIRFEPTDNFNANFMHQTLSSDALRYGGSVFGSGHLGGTFRSSEYADPITLQPGYNGPVLGKHDRKTIREHADRSKATQEITTGQINYTFGGHTLSYVGGRSTNETKPGRSYADVGNLVIGDWPGRSLGSEVTRWSHELRLSSDESMFDFIDYTVGVFYLDEKINNSVNNGKSFRAGAFGSPLGAPSPYAPNLDYSTTSFADIESEVEELSYFGTLTFHLTDSTELAVGFRQLNAEKEGSRQNSQSGGWDAKALSASDCLASGGSFERTYSNICDVPIASRMTGDDQDHWKKSTTLYSATLSQRISEEFMVYLNYGESWRPGPTQGTLINGANDPYLASLQQLDDEESNSIELGLKSSWFEDRLSVNLAYYKQKYSNYVSSDLSGIPYLADTGVGTRFVTFAIPMNSNIDVEVEGVDLDFNFAVSDRLRMGGAVSWADAGYDDQLIPCWDGNFDGVADREGTAFIPSYYDAAGVKIAECASSGPASQIPKWSANLRASYNYPITDRLDGFVSANLNYTPENPYANPEYTTPSYTLVDLNLGVRNDVDGWEIQLFVRNLMNDDTVLNIGSRDLISSTSSAPGSIFGASGYTSVAVQQPREIGLTFRYAFGSR